MLTIDRCIAVLGRVTLLEGLCVSIAVGPRLMPMYIKITPTSQSKDFPTGLTNWKVEKRMPQSLQSVETSCTSGLDRRSLLPAPCSLQRCTKPTRPANRADVAGVMLEYMTGSIISNAVVYSAKVTTSSTGNMADSRNSGTPREELEPPYHSNIPELRPMDKECSSRVHSPDCLALNARGNAIRGILSDLYVELGISSGRVTHSLPFEDETLEVISDERILLLYGAYVDDGSQAGLCRAQSVPN